MVVDNKLGQDILDVANTYDNAVNVGNQRPVVYNEISKLTERSRQSHIWPAISAMAVFAR
jgi:hypothetical protein